MTLSAEPGTLSGTITIPPSKSMTQRACAAALLHKGKSVILQAGHSADERAALGILQQCGAALSFSNDGAVTVHSRGVQPAEGRLYCGESGLAARLFTPIAALYDGPVLIEGSGSLLNRPMHLFEQVLPLLGVQVSSSGGGLPIRIQGPLQARSVAVDGSLSSQFLSGLLFALSEAAESTVHLQVSNPVSLPYLDLSLQTLAQLGRPLRHNAAYTEFVIDPAAFREPEQPVFPVEADWSSAAVWVAAACMGHPLKLRGLNLLSVQADRAILEVVQQTGVRAYTDAERLLCFELPSTLHSFEFDATHCPDLFPVLAVLAGACGGSSRISGLQRLRHKESDRAASTSYLLRSMGIACRTEEDALVVEGGRPFRSAVLSSFNDHRIVMAGLLAASVADGPARMEQAEAVSKSYPDFFRHLQQAGLPLQLRS